MRRRCARKSVSVRSADCLLGWNFGWARQYELYVVPKVLLAPE